MIGDSTIHVLIVDDEEHICNIISEALKADNFQLSVFNCPKMALEHIKNNPIDLVITDLVMGEHSGEQILETTIERHPDAMIILMTAHPTVQAAISILKKGAYDFMVKPFKLDLLKSTVKRAIEHQKILRDNVRLRGQVDFLKIANADAAGIDIDHFLNMVVESCKKELGAVAAGIFEIAPKTREVLRFASACDREELEEVVLDESVLNKFARTKSSKPVIEAKRIMHDGESKIELAILQPVFIRRTLHGVINLRIISQFGRITPGQLDVLTILSNAAASAMSNHKLYQDVQRSYLEAIRGLANAIEARDRYTAGHTDRVTRLAEMVAHALDWDDHQVMCLQMGCTLHDIGKIGVPDSILNKQSALTDEERKKMISHPEVGLRIIRGIDLFKPAIPYIRSHHERWDGKGYPKKLKGVEIPIEGRLLSVVDTFDAILSDRPYRKGASLAVAVGELVKYRGIQFDPNIVDVFLGVIRRGEVNFEEMYGRSEDISCLDEIVVTEKASV